jgi:hypothetical protein
MDPTGKQEIPIGHVNNPQHGELIVTLYAIVVPLLNENLLLKRQLMQLTNDLIDAGHDITDLTFELHLEKQKHGHKA